MKFHLILEERKYKKKDRSYRFFYHEFKHLLDDASTCVKSKSTTSKQTIERSYSVGIKTYIYKK